MIKTFGVFKTRSRGSCSNMETFHLLFILLSIFSYEVHAGCNMGILKDMNSKLERQTSLLLDLLSQGNQRSNLSTQFESQKSTLESMQKQMLTRDRLLISLMQRGVFGTLDEKFQDIIREMEKEQIADTSGQKLRLTAPASDCADLQASGHIDNGVYSIVLPHSGRQAEVYCDMTTDGGGWLVFQSRMNGSVDFYRNYDSYVNGFGDPNTDFWLGLDALYDITSTKEYEMRVDMASQTTGLHGFARYTSFAVGGPQNGYNLILGRYSKGNAGDSLGNHNGQPFSARDRDQDASYTTACAQTHRGGWWFHSCRDSNLNGMTGPANEISPRTMVWRSYQKWRTLASASMMIRPPRD